MSTDGGAPGAGAGQGGDGGAGNTGAGAGASTDWTSGFNDELKGYVTSKGFKDPASVLESYRNSESLIGKLKGVGSERIIGLPEKADAPEWKDIWNKLGTPKEAKEYQFEMPKEGGDEKFTEWAKTTMHKLNVPRSQAEGLIKEWNAYMGTKQQETQTGYQTQIAQQDEALKTEWGQAYEQNINLGKSAVREFGFTAEVVDALEKSMGYSGVMKLMHTLGSKVGEDNFVGSGGGGADGSFGGGKLSPGQATAEISAKMNDSDFQRRLIAGEQIANDEWTRLHKFLG